jgi:hypothetical protein
MMRERVQFKCGSAVGVAMAVPLSFPDMRASHQRFDNCKIAVDNDSNAHIRNCPKLSVRHRVS